MEIKSSYRAYVENYIGIALTIIVVYLIRLQLGSSIIFLISLVFGVILITYLLNEPFYKRMVYKYVVGDNSVSEIKGIIRKTTITIPYSNISDVSLYQGVFGRMLNFGDITITSMKGNIKMEGIADAKNVYYDIKTYVEKKG